MKLLPILRQSTKEFQSGEYSNYDMILFKTKAVWTFFREMNINLMTVNESDPSRHYAFLL